MDETAPATGDAHAQTLPIGDAVDGPLRSGTRIGRYVVLERLGHGGMGEVYACHDPALDRRVAVKLLHPGAAGSTATDQLVQRLRKEAQAAARLSHRNVVTVFDVGLAELDERGKVFVAMELIEGGTLDAWAKKERRWDEIVAMYLEAGRGLAVVHSAGIVHRDFKPSNVLVTKDGEPKVSDFGLATTADDEGDIAGTPAFMPPEQRRGGKVDARADIYAFCVALFRAVYGVYPYGDDAAQTAKRSEANELVEVVARRGPPALLRLLRAGLDADPEKRPATMEALLGDLGTLVTRRPRWLLPAIVAGIAACAALAIYLAGRPGAAPCGGARREIESVWGPTERDAVARGFATSKLDFAAASAERAAKNLDRWAARWATAHEGVCRATRVDRSQSERAMDLRMACLARQRADLGSLVELLVRGEPDVIARAAQLALGLPPPDQCDDVGTLEAAGNQDPELARRIGDAELRSDAGRYDETIELATSALADAQKSGARAMQARAGLALGAAQMFSGDYEAARATLFHAALDAQVTHQASIAVRAWAATLIVLEGQNGSEADEAQAFAQGQAALEAADHELPREEAILLQDHASYLFDRARKPEEAIPIFERVLVILRERVDPDNPTVASALDGLGGALVTTGEVERGIQLERDALALRERLFGAEHPVVAWNLSNLAISLTHVGKRDEAEAMYRRTLEIEARTLRPHHPSISNTLIELAELLVVERRFDEAVDVARQDVALWEAEEGDKSDAVPKSRRELGDILVVAGRPDDAIAEYEAARTRLVALKQTEDAARTSMRLVRPLIERGRIADAEAALVEGDALGTPNVTLYIAHARVELARGDRKKAKAALDAAEKLGTEHPEDVLESTWADLRLLQADLRHAAGDETGAKALADEVRTICVEVKCGRWTADRLQRADAYAQ